MLRECITLLRSVSFQFNVRDSWRWQLEPSTSYTVSSTYQLLTAQDTPHVAHVAALIWHKQVPLKISIFAWRLLQNRLPTRSNLVDRGIITDADVGCLTSCGGMETSQHLFITCDFYNSLWHKVQSWLGVSGPDPLDVSDHFYQFTHSTGGLRARRSFLQLVWLLCAWIIWNDCNHILFNNWLLCAWIIWNDCNHILFNNIENFIDQLLDKVKNYSLWWLKASNANFVYGFSSWWSSPLVCFGIG
jgi:hypothetical protein